MKKLLVIAALCASHSAPAAIENSNLEPRHQTLIKNAVYNSCGLSGVVEQTANQEEVIFVDQGIRDVKYTTTLAVKVGVDQYMYDEYSVIVKSEYADMYDHVSKNWGVYSIENVFCYDKNN